LARRQTERIMSHVARTSAPNTSELRTLLTDIESLIHSSKVDAEFARDEFADAQRALVALRRKLQRGVLQKCLSNVKLDLPLMRDILLASGFEVERIGPLLAGLARDAGCTPADELDIDPDFAVKWLCGDHVAKQPRRPKRTLARAVSAGCSTKELDERALSVHYISTTLGELAHEKGCGAHPKVYDINDDILLGMTEHVICPRDGKAGAAFVDLIDGEDNVGKATHMLSYTWGYELRDIAESLTAWCEEHGLDPKRTYVWMCCSCVNQHRVKEALEKKEVVSFERFQSVFQSRVKGIGKVIALMMPWDKPLYLSRAWCMYEMYTAVTLGDECELTILMPPREQHSFLTHVLESGDIMKIWDSLSKATIKIAEATVPSDRDNIHKVVAETDGGVQAFDKKVKEHIQQWFLQTAIHFVEQRPFIMMSRLLKFATMMNDMHMMDDADKLLEYCKDNFGLLSRTPFSKGTSAASKPGAVPDYIACVFHQRGWLRHKQRRIEDAIGIYTEGIKAAQDAGATGLGLSRLQLGRGRSLCGDEPDEEFRDPGDRPSSERVETAIQDYQESIRLLELNSMLETEDGAKALSNLSIAHTLAENYDDALDALRHTEAIRERLGTLGHPSNSRRLYNLGSVHLKRFRTRNTDDLAGEWKSACIAFEESNNIAHSCANCTPDAKCNEKLKWLEERTPPVWCRTSSSELCA